MNAWDDMIQLAKLLETEWRGGDIDRARVRELAATLMPRHPEIRTVLNSVRERMSRG